jgi:hypothetical protein
MDSAAKQLLRSPGLRSMGGLRLPPIEGMGAGPATQARGLNNYQILQF